MGNVFQLFIRYGAIIGRFAQYIQYLPLLAALIDFVRTAQRDFAAAGTNEQKAAWVADRFRAFLAAFVSAGLVSQSRSDRITPHIDAFVTAVVQWYNLTLGSVPPAPPAPRPDDPPTSTSSFPYDVVLQFHPLTMDEATLLRPTDRIFKRRGTERGWLVPTNPQTVGRQWILDPTQPPQPTDHIFESSPATQPLPR